MKKFVNRIMYAKDAVSYGVKTLELRKDKERIEKMLSKVPMLEKFQNSPQCMLLKTELKQTEMMFEIYKDFTMQCVKGFLD